jgi:CBS domain-containing protein
VTVNEIMTSRVKSCGADTDLAAVAKTMWDCDCGVVPVIDETQKVIGMITDRDICIASATRSETPAQLRAREVMTHGEVHACSPDDDVRTALRTMKKHRVRRLPVLDRQQRLLGILSLNDLVVPLSFRDSSGVPGEEFIDTLRAISSHTTRPVSE